MIISLKVVLLLLSSIFKAAWAKAIAPRTGLRYGLWVSNSPDRDLIGKYISPVPTQGLFGGLAPAAGFGLAVYVRNVTVNSTIDQKLQHKLGPIPLGRPFEFIDGTFLYDEQWPMTYLPYYNRDKGKYESNAFTPDYHWWGPSVQIPQDKRFLDLRTIDNAIRGSIGSGDEMNLGLDNGQGREDPFMHWYACDRETKKLYDETWEVRWVEWANVKYGEAIGWTDEISRITFDPLNCTLIKIGMLDYDNCKYWDPNCKAAGR